MMMSPEMYVELNRDEPIEEIIKIRDELIDNIKNLEKIVFSKDRSSEEWNFHPGPDVRYQVNLEYLSQICVLLSEKYNAKYEV